MEQKMAKSFMVMFMVLLVQACAAPTPEPTVTLAPTATPVPTATETAAPTESATPANAPGYEVLTQYEGEWSGTWQNTTFGSTGDAMATVTVNNDGTMELILDLDGFVFGAIDPPAVTLTGTYTASDATLELVDDATFGTIALVFTADGEVDGSFDNLMLAGGTMSVTGSHSPEHIEIGYSLVLGAINADGVLILDHE